jgi:tetrahydromethanopterin S-methyltransferase subunit G
MSPKDERLPPATVRTFRLNLIGKRLKETEEKKELSV